ncbi:hypothetical protein GQX74_006458 [Glossina fuscipes]|nr:hypothetical protein GQX74_006458 [Glossina fuscipes]
MLAHYGCFIVIFLITATTSPVTGAAAQQSARQKHNIHTTLRPPVSQQILQHSRTEEKKQHLNMKLIVVATLGTSVIS